MVVCPFVLFLLVIVWSVLLRYTDSDYPFGFFKLFLDDQTKRTATTFQNTTRKDLLGQSQKGGDDKLVNMITPQPC
jgi:hypothetical protein